MFINKLKSLKIVKSKHENINDVMRILVRIMVRMVLRMMMIVMMRVEVKVVMIDP